MKFTGVLFDLDGTLLDTADDLGAALNFVLQQHGRAAIPADLYTPQASNGSKGLLTLGFGHDFAGLDFNSLKQQFLTYYQQHIAEHTGFFADVVSTLEYLNAQGIPWGVVTNKPAFLTDPLLAEFPIFKHSKINVSGDTLSVAKPHPQPILHALAALNIRPEQCLYVGDAIRDIEAAHAAGLPAAAACYGYIASDDDVNRWEADFQFKTLSDLMALV